MSPKKYEKTAKLIDEIVKKRLCKTMSESQKSYVQKQKHVAFSKLNSSLYFNPIDNLKQNGFDIIDDKCSMKEDKLRKFSSVNILSDAKANPFNAISVRKIPKNINYSMRLINQSLSKLNQNSTSTMTIKDSDESSAYNLNQIRQKDRFSVINSYLRSIEKLNSVSSNFDSPLDASSLNFDCCDPNIETTSQSASVPENNYVDYTDQIANSLKDDENDSISPSSKVFNNNELNQSFEEFNNNYISDDLWSGSSRLSYEKRASSPSLKYSSMRKFKNDPDTISLKETYGLKNKKSHLKNINGNVYGSNSLNSETETTIVTEKDYKLKKQAFLRPLKNQEKHSNESCNFESK